MKNQRNYQKELDALLETLRETGRRPRLFLHSCCAPCSSYVLEYLAPYFEITDFYYNPNISPESEYNTRAGELERMIREMGIPVEFRSAPYEPAVFFRAVQGMEELPEGGERCRICYELRLREAARIAAAENFDYFTTTLSISPLKNAVWINEIGEALEAEYHVKHLPSDFKKRGGYARSVQLSKEYDLYRQNYCGCIFSKKKAGEGTSVPAHGSSLLRE